MENQGASVVITHHILDGKRQEYEKWLDEIVPITKHSEGFIDLQIVRPIPDLTFVYTVIIRFDTISHLKHWMESDNRKMLIEKANPLFRKNDNYKIKSGLDFLFESENETKVPVRWKQFLVTWSAIYPLSLLIPLFVLPFLRFLKIPVNHYFDGLIVSGCIVFLMVFAVMPNYTRLIRKWLYK
ncbi:antibiotic biosynthesis monooxygenase (ABM) superfamily enzyme [Chryseobacterium ginsenosidimutans]|uniref:antibiotic biosynthesis monooxygenase n=1 Tax=Chryseobacterium ginsenosidimutans TaxID=687846 RepID=UPI0027823DA4|nr:antibiotic biosynthesis monooxygenase [Chryseobacterium ginsenosidimutans]MDQ0594530.1 antibiotic biosynthesis monooxygenase (ABM) superfamily enzyme [Chryseobacterium ginsenosidimutans]